MSSQYNRIRIVLAFGLVALVVAGIVRAWSEGSAGKYDDSPARMVQSWPPHDVDPAVAVPKAPVNIGQVKPARELGHRTAYRITELGNEAPDDTCLLNDAGDIVCDLQLYHRGRWTELPLPNDRTYNEESGVSAINKAGDEAGWVGWSESGAYSLFFDRQVIWRRGKIQTVSPDDGSQAVGIDNRGDVLTFVSGQDNVGFDYSGYLTVNGRRRNLSPGHPVCMNNYAAVVMDRLVRHEGTGDNYYADDHGKTVRFIKDQYYLMRGRTKYAIEAPASCTIESVCRVNDRDEVVGNIDTGIPSTGDGMHPDVDLAFLWRRGKITPIGSFGGPGSLVGGINNQGAVVGQADVSGRADANGKPPTHAFIYQNGRVHDLNHFISSRSGWVLYRAWDINNRGQIVCTGNKGLCLLTPIDGG